MFWTSTRPWSGALGLALAVTAVAADVVENVCLLVANRAHTAWLDVATGATVVKFSSLVPAAVIGICELVTTVARLVRNHKSALKNRKQIEVFAPRPMTVADADMSAGTSAVGNDTIVSGPERWRRGYHVPVEMTGVRSVRDELDIEALGDEVIEVDFDRSIVIEPDFVADGGVGVCLSGGGVRSASVALGAMQSLRAVLQRARYLVSVSGGGFTAGALQLALTDAGDEQQKGSVIHDSEQAFAPGSVEESGPTPRRLSRVETDGADQCARRRRPRNVAVAARAVRAALCSVSPSDRHGSGCHSHHTTPPR